MSATMHADDPLLAPIHGIGMEQYALLSAELLTEGVTGLGAIERYTADKGVLPGTWADVQRGWIERMRDSAALRRRYGAICSRVGRPS
ncbi:MAG: hypothetical protein ACYC2O_05475 [Microthrixaceae bacterium]